MKTLSAVFITLLTAVPALAVVSEWGQCGGLNWTGETTCVAGTVCTAQNAYYSQCIKGSTTAGPTSTSTSTTKSSTTTSSSSTTKTSTSATSTSSAPAATGFIKTSGQKFTLNGQPFTVVGSNSYWVGFSNLNTADMNLAFSDIAKTGATTVRTWGFNDVTSTSGGTAYYQLWNGATPTINTGADGLASFDKVVASAKANGLRLIVALTNNWSDYGGMDVYVKALTGSTNHDLFYTDAKVIAAFKNYINAFVTRYKNEPTILGWELANEPRCKGSTGATSGTCTPATITAWAKNISAYIKSIDSNHLVGLGDEGFYNKPGSASYPYQGGEGIDFDANLAISTLDFGTFHAYPESWGESASPEAWGKQWIIDHAASQKAANKPVIIEEFGVATANQKQTYTTWLDTVVSSGLTGDLIWQAGTHFATWSSWDDGYAIYPDDPVYPLLTSHSAALKARG